MVLRPFQTEGFKALPLSDKRLVLITENILFLRVF